MESYVEKSICYVTKDKYSGAKRVLGFIKRLGNHLYYDFFSQKYVLEDTIDDQNKVLEYIKIENVSATIPLRKIETYFDLCNLSFYKKSIEQLKAFDENCIRKAKCSVVEIDLEDIQSNLIKIILDLVCIDFYEEFFEEKELTYAAMPKIVKSNIDNKIFLGVTILDEYS